MPPPDRLADARRLLVLAELLWRARRHAAVHGVLPADAAARGMVEPARQLRAAVEAAVEAAEAAEEGSDAREAALAEVARAAEVLSQSVDEQWEGIRALFGVAIAGVRGQVSRRPEPPDRLGQPRRGPT